MGLRLELQTLLEEVCDHVYFQPPSNVQMQYPCIVYGRDSSETEFADNGSYRHTWRYQVTVIDRNPDSDIPNKVAGLRMCLFNRHYTADNLHHDVFNLYF